ncbi:ATP-dependent metallopeptidase FtsH/Yme1/Tma family protein [Roseiterribacter gracilis]|uniref:ATP-dependent zinc metalloprotease FtsH n=1 Tax=Roseiterribacter gracilis TaxID=2812848 RepID=A0A8S8XD68_9PROT|nr:ATP-dependent zinc metalloprotease FtsH [Rhodospirillales bacterium TMPK1]
MKRVIDRLTARLSQFRRRSPHLVAGIAVGVVVLTLLGARFVDMTGDARPVARQASFSEVTALADGGQIKRIEIVPGGIAQVRIETTAGEHVETLVPGQSDFLRALVRPGVDARFIDPVVPGLRFREVLDIIFVLLLLSSIGLVVRASPLGQRTRSRLAVRPAERLDDVAGIDEVRGELLEVVRYLRDPAPYIAVGAKVPRGVLLAGAPGLGKTLMAKALAGEAEVPFFAASGSDFVELFVGNGARKIRALFKQCRKAAPCILFIDELDALASARSSNPNGGGDREHDQTLNAFLVEMDGLSSRDGIVVVAATNRTDVLDPAVLRPGRFDRRVQVPRPDAKGREKILRVHTRNVPLAADVDLAELGAGTIGMSGADLANLVNEAALHAARQGLREVAAASFHYAQDRVLVGVARESSSMHDDDRRVAAIHEAGHALVALRCKHSDRVARVTIVPHGDAAGFVLRLPDRDRVVISRDRLEDDLAIALGGRAAEELVFGDGSATTGAASDLQRATEVCREMAGRYGMFPETGLMTYLGHEMSPQALAALDDTVRSRLEQAYARACRVLNDERDALHRIADRLIDVGTIDGAEALALADNATPQRAIA